MRNWNRLALAAGFMIAMHICGSAQAVALPAKEVSEPCQQLSQGLMPHGVITGSIGGGGQADPLNELFRQIVDQAASRPQDQFETTAEFQQREDALTNAMLAKYKEIVLQTIVSPIGGMKYVADTEMVFLDPNLFTIDSSGSHYYASFGDSISSDIRFHAPRDLAKIIYDLSRNINLTAVSVISLVKPLYRHDRIDNIVIHKIKTEILCLAIRDAQASKILIYVDRPQAARRPF